MKRQSATPTLSPARSRPSSTKYAFQTFPPPRGAQEGSAREVKIRRGTKYLERKVQTLLSKAGITINGGEPHDVRVHNPAMYARVFRRGTLGLGESYMDGWWDCERLDEFFYRIFSSDLEGVVPQTVTAVINRAGAALLNLQSRSRAFAIGEAHYDIGNDLYAAMLDRRMTYTCGYWEQARDLDAAQESKLDLTCRKIGLKQGDRILDVGCGWGSFAKFAAENYGARVVGITVSAEQVQLAKKRCEGLDVEIRLQDYRDVNDTFDHIVSLGMFEHVGVKNYRKYFDAVRKNLRQNGLFLLHTIGNNVSRTTTDPWIHKYIFPNSMLPSAKQITTAAEGLFTLEDWHNFGADYDKTLMAWHANFEQAWPRLRAKYGERFRRMWRYYLSSCAGNFRARKLNLWQIAFSPRGVPGGYRAVR